MAFLNETGLEQVWSKIKTKVSSIENTIGEIDEAKVDKVDGKVLSTNDYTTDEKNKLAGIATGATNVIVDSELNGTSTNAIQNQAVANMKSEIDNSLKNMFATTEKEGNPVSEIGIADIGFSIKTIFEPEQEGHGDPSPDNIRPITGWTGLTLTRCGKNLIDLSQGYGYDKLNSLVVPAGTPIAFSFFPTDGTSQLKIRIILDDNSESEYSIIEENAVNNTWYKFAITISTRRIKKYSIYSVDGSNARTISEGMIEYGSSPTSYEPYQGDTYTANFGQTIYGGTLEWNTGKLMVEWGLISSYAGEELPGKWISDRDVYSTNATPTIGAQIAFKQAIPITIQLTPYDLYMIDGTNNIYSDGMTNYVIFNSGVSFFSKATELFFKKTDGISLTGSVTGFSTIDSRGNLRIATTTNHTHPYLPLSGGTLTDILTIKNDSSTKLQLGNSSYDGLGALAYWAPSDNPTSRFYFQQFSRSSTDYSFLSAYESFYLPDTTADKTTSVNYDILTTKFAVTVAQGGTGATSKYGARINLGITSGTSLPSTGSQGDIFFLY